MSAKSCHFIGIGGIGMSGLAAWYQAQNYHVTGSDRGADKPENAVILNALRASGITIYPQDGSFIRHEKPDFLVYSTAIEADNRDFSAAPNLPKVHRSQALQQAILAANYDCTIAVSGSCGKSTVTAFLAETLVNLGADPDCLNGALVKNFRTATQAGNYRRGAGKMLIFEADESDKSLLAYHPDYSIVLNIGHDHYDQAELARVFAKLIDQTKKGAVVSRQVYDLVKPILQTPPPQVSIFETAVTGDATVSGISRYERGTMVLSQSGAVVKLPLTGFHSALNALAVAKLCELLGFAPPDIWPAVTKFGGVKRRFEKAGCNANNVTIYDDYAHNPEKIVSALRSARECTFGQIFLVYQPHGFGPLGFMRDVLGAMLKAELRPGEYFYLLPPYYAGGTSSFTPSSTEVIGQFKQQDPSHCYEAFADRDALTAVLLRQSRPGDVIVVMGARDNSLSDYAAFLARQ